MPAAAARHSLRPARFMHPSRPFILRPIATSLLMAGLLLLGIAAYRTLPVSALPQVDFPTIQVTAQLPGASPETMASSVATPLERYFSEIAGVTELTSTSTFGATSITVQFDLARDIDAAAQDIQAAINQAGGQLPRNLPNPPIYRKVNPADSPVLVLAVSAPGMPLSQVDDLADTVLGQQISRVSGVSLVTIGGEQKPAVRVQIDPPALANLGLGFEDVRTALGAVTVDAPKGSFNGPHQSYTIDANDQLTGAAAFRRQIVAYRNGAPIRVSDLGTATDGVENNLLAAWYGPERAIILVIYRTPGANIIQTVDSVLKQLPAFQRAMPPLVKVSVVSDRSQSVRASVADMQINLLIAVGLVVLVIFLFLRTPIATLIPSAAVPLSLIGTFAVMPLFHYSIDNLSLMGLTIATGFVVDDAIVMIENIVRHVEDGKKPMEAALEGSAEIGFTILSMTASLVAVFIPLLFMAGIVGRVFREFAVTVTVAILLSLVVSLTLTPMLCAWLLPAQSGQRSTRHGRIYRWSEAAFVKTLAGYESSLGWVLRHRLLMLIVLLGTIALTGFLFVTIPKGFFPQQDAGFIVGTAEGPQDSSFEAMGQRLQALIDIVRRDPDVANVAGFMGSGGGGANAGNTGRLFVSLKPFKQRKASAQAVIERLRPQTAKIQGVRLFLQAAQDINVGGRLARSQYQYTIEDNNMDELAQWAPKLEERLRQIPGVVDVGSDLQNAALRASLDIDRDTAARLGITPELIDDTLYDAFGQRQVATIYGSATQYHVILEADPRYQLGPESLSQIYVRSASGASVPLSAFVRVSERPGVLSINHQRQFPSVTLSFNLSPGTSLGSAVQAIERAGAEIRLPATVQGSFQGTAQAFQTSLASQPLLIGAALIVIYIVLGVLYESLVHPITILSTLPSAGVGALLALMLLGYDLSVIALIGILLLIGIVKKNAIMMIDFALAAERGRRQAAEQAIFEAAKLRFRPIMMTTLAALFGALPLAIGSGAGSELRRPMGIAIIGGLLLSQLLTLYTTPVVYIYLDRLGSWLRERRRGSRTAPEPGRFGAAPPHRR
jgi:hydrophobe/amphiphile efflux-1 (HAE1) family protein